MITSLRPVIALSLGFAVIAGIAACSARAADAPPSGRDDLATAWARDRAPLTAALKPTEIAGWTPADHAPLIELDAKLDPATGTITGEQRSWIPAPAGGATTAALRCPANGAAFNGASITITHATWNGADLAAPAMSEENSGFTWNLPDHLAPGQSGCLATTFTATPSAKGFHGLMGRVGGRWCLYHWHPELPAWRDGTWFLPPVTGIGDESQTPLAPVLLHLTVPIGTQVICAGIIARVPAGPGWNTLTVAAPTCRNLALEVVTGGDPHLVGGMLTIDGVQVRSWADSYDAAAGARALAVAVAAVSTYDRDFGSYPLNGLDVVETVQGDDVGGMESSGLVFIDSRMYAGVQGMGPSEGIENFGIFELTIAVAHEVGHQWWYGMVGSDAFADPWMDESLTNSCEDLVVETMYGPNGRKASRNYHQLEAFSQSGALTEPIDRPLTAYVEAPAAADGHHVGGGGMMDYAAVVYGRGALMYLALRKRLGDERYFAWLREWLAAHRYGVATPADWHAHLAEILGPDEAQKFSDRWLSGHGMTRAVVMAEVFGVGTATAAAPTEGASATAASATEPATSASSAQPAP
jgi:hypothetical protein